MNVADVQQLLDDVSRLLMTGSGKVQRDLTTFRNGLTPFRDQSVKDFVALLAKADATSRSETMTSAGTGKARRGKKAAQPDAAAIGQELRELYERVADPSVTVDSIEKMVDRLGDLTAAGLVAVAEGIGLHGMKGKKKDHVIKAIRQRFFDRKGTSQRAGLGDRPHHEPNHDRNGPNVEARAEGATFD